jgi:hypothetical protein
MLRDNLKKNQLQKFKSKTNSNQNNNDQNSYKYKLALHIQLLEDLARNLRWGERK